MEKIPTLNNLKSPNRERNLDGENSAGLGSSGTTETGVGAAETSQHIKDINMKRKTEDSNLKNSKQPRALNAENSAGSGFANATCRTSVHGGVIHRQTGELEVYYPPRKIVVVRVGPNFAENTIEVRYESTRPGV